MARILSVLATVLLVVCMGNITAFAVTPAEKPTFYTLRPIAPETQKEPLALMFEIDGKACNDAYGYQWPQVCNAPAMREGVMPAISMTPPREGQWMWEAQNRLIFTPRQPWQPQEHFKVTVEAGSLAPRARLANSTATITTPPLATRINNSNLVIDRSPRSSHWVSFDIGFTYPVPTVITGKEFAAQVVPPALGLALGEPELVWNTERTQLTVSTPINTLGEQAGVVEFTAQGLPGVWRGENGKHAIRKEPAQERIRVPGKVGFLEVADVSLRLASNDKLQKEYRLHLTFNVLMRQKTYCSMCKCCKCPCTAPRKR